MYLVLCQMNTFACNHRHSNTHMPHFPGITPIRSFRKLQLSLNYICLTISSFFLSFCYIMLLLSHLLSNKNLIDWKKNCIIVLFDLQCLKTLISEYCDFFKGNFWIISFTVTFGWEHNIGDISCEKYQMVSK